MAIPKLLCRLIWRRSITCSNYPQILISLPLVKCSHTHKTNLAAKEVCHHHDTLKSLQLKVIMSFLAGRDVVAILPTGTERAFAMLFSRSFLISCIDCNKIAAVASRRETFIQSELAILQLGCQWNQAQAFFGL